MRAMEEPMRQSINACVSSYARSRFKPADPTLARSRLHARIEMHLQAHRAWEMPCFSVCERRSALLCEQLPSRGAICRVLVTRRRSFRRDSGQRQRRVSCRLGRRYPLLICSVVHCASIREAVGSLANEWCRLGC